MADSSRRLSFASSSASALMPSAVPHSLCVSSTYAVPWTPPGHGSLCRLMVFPVSRSAWIISSSSLSVGRRGRRFGVKPLADIHKYPPPTAIPLVLCDSVLTWCSTLPVFQSTLYAFSDTCPPIQRASLVASRAFGCSSRDL